MCVITTATMHDGSKHNVLTWCVLPRPTLLTAFWLPCSSPIRGFLKYVHRHSQRCSASKICSVYDWLLMSRTAQSNDALRTTLNNTRSQLYEGTIIGVFRMTPTSTGVWPLPQVISYLTIILQHHWWIFNVWELNFTSFAQDISFSTTPGHWTLEDLFRGLLDLCYPSSWATKARITKPSTNRVLSITSLFLL